MESTCSSLTLKPLKQSAFFVRLLLISGTIALTLGISFILYWAIPSSVITASGGIYFFRPLLLSHVPSFAQDDPRWQDQPLGHTTDTLGAEGCAVTSVAMVLCSYGVNTDPKQLNDYLTLHNGYTDQGWIYWERGADLSQGKVEKAYEDNPSYALLDLNLWQGNPVIVRLDLPGGATHFVVVVGKEGWDYLIQDPAWVQGGIYPLKQRSNKITGLRYYRQVTPSLFYR